MCSSGLLLTLALLTSGCGGHLPYAHGQPLSAAEGQFLAAVTASGPISEATDHEPILPQGLPTLPNYKYTKLILQPAPGADPANAQATGVFEYWPFVDRVIWKLTIRNFKGFTGAHLHYADLASGGFDHYW